MDTLDIWATIMDITTIGVDMASQVLQIQTMLMVTLDIQATTMDPITTGVDMDPLKLFQKMEQMKWLVQGPVKEKQILELLQ